MFVWKQFWVQEMKDWWSAIVNQADAARFTLKQLESAARKVKALIIASDTDWRDDKGECIAHATLAMRAIETARMHYGKVLQYSDVNLESESIYDQEDESAT